MKVVKIISIHFSIMIVNVVYKIGMEFYL